MKHVQEEKSYIAVDKYRVECNHGNKFFLDEDTACCYIDYMEARGFDAELWLVRTYYDQQGNKVKCVQFLMELEWAN